MDVIGMKLNKKSNTSATSSLYLRIESELWGGLLAVQGTTYATKRKKWEISHQDAKNLDLGPLTELLTYAKSEVNRNTSLEFILDTADDAEIDSFVEVEMKTPDNTKQKTKFFLVSSEFENLDVPSFTDNKKNVQRNYKPKN